MSDLQRLMDEAFRDTPRLVFRLLIEKKLRVAGVDPESGLIDQIIDHIVSDSSKSFQWEDNGSTDTNVQLTFSKEDVAELERMSSQLLTSIPDIVSNTATDIAESLLDTLKDKWKQEHSHQVEEQQAFRVRLEQQWGKALNLLRMLLTISRELGSEIAERLPPHKSHLRNVLTRLHVRACQVTAEIITLLENGFADGAMARWRTLHEIGIVMVLISEHGEQLAERYIAHRFVEAKSGKDQYALCFEQLGYERLSPTECREIDEEYDRVIAIYGKEFRGPYGWAAGYVSKGHRSLGLGDLEAAAGRAVMASHYKLASYNIHAGPHALFFRLGLLDESGFLAGASNAGFTEPGQNTALSLTLISAFLVGDNVILDNLVSMKILQLLRDEIPRAFVRAEHKPETDNARHRQKKRKFGMTRRLRLHRSRY